ncbi:MAG: hypothetical protein EXS08_16910 [Planctomycetes bacterium]|nr:hypothetical protein [Planctomycetota bacterium]
MPPLPGRSHSTGRVLLAGKGLRPSALRFRLTRAGERWTVVKGPLAGANEADRRLLPDGARLARRGARLHDRFVHILGGTRELDLRPVAEA